VEPFAFEESWEVIGQVFPSDREAIARQSGSFRRARTGGTAETLLRLLRMHGSGLSLRQTVSRAKEQGLGTLSAVALFKRLRQREAFLQQLARGVLEQVQARASQTSWPGGYRCRIIDATTVKEPGPTGSCGRLHDSLRLPQLCGDHVELTGLDQGESFKRWQASPNEVLLAARAYGHREAVGALSDQGLKVVVRLNGHRFALLTDQGRPVKLLSRLARLANRPSAGLVAALRLRPETLADSTLRPPQRPGGGRTVRTPGAPQGPTQAAPTLPSSAQRYPHLRFMVWTS
jgi:hypothetical protein